MDGGWERRRFLRTMAVLLACALALTAATLLLPRDLRPAPVREADADEHAVLKGPARPPVPAPGDPRTVTAIRGAVARLPKDGATRVGDVEVPAGRRVLDDTGTTPLPVWATDAPVPVAGRLAARLMKAYPKTGLWPLLVTKDDDRQDDAPNIAEWFNAVEQNGPGADRDPAVAFREAWNLYLNSDPGSVPDPMIAPAFGKAFPGLGTPVGPVSHDVPADILGIHAAHIVLVAVERPADFATVTGWLGATNYSPAADLAVLLRSWEDRYGAEPVEIGLDTLRLAVRNPPRSIADARAAAAEIYAVCPDMIWQGDPDMTVEDFARGLVGANEWFCWWD